MKKDRTEIHKTLSPEQQIYAYRLMYTSRRLDDRDIALRKRNEAYFAIAGAGHECILSALGIHLRPSSDWFFLYYRDRALALSLGMTAEEMLLQSVGAEADPASGGRQMPAHWGRKDLNIASVSSPTGSQFLHATGCADVSRWLREGHLKGASVSGDCDDQIIVVTSGDGTTSQGDFWEMLGTICVKKLPVLCLVEDNGYAISVPVSVQTPGGHIGRAFERFPGLKSLSVDGVNFQESYEVCGQAVRHVRSGKGPVLLHASVTRPYSHSLSDDHRLYRTKSELEQEKERDPITLMEASLLKQGLQTEQDLEEIRKDVNKEIDAAMDRVAVSPRPGPDTAMRHLFCEDDKPTDSRYESEPVWSDDETEIPMGQLINRCMHDEMARDERVVVFGEDVADASLEESLREVSGKGGVFKITHGLQKAYGSHRVFNTPLAEANIIGRAIGMALRGLVPVVEIQFFDYIWTAMNQIRNELATMRYRSNNTFCSPVVIRVPIGGYLRGGGIYHSQTGESLFVHTPGLRVVYPSNACDAHGLLRTAIRCQDPVLYLEHKHLYYQGYNKSRYPGPNYTIPFGKAAVARVGSDLSIVTWGALVQKSLQASKTVFDEDGIECEVIDIRTLNPMDWETVFRSVRKTSRLLVAHEENLTAGFGAEIAARVQEECFYDLDAPIARIASMDTWVAYQPAVEEAILPQTADIVGQIRSLMRA